MKNGNCTQKYYRWLKNDGERSRKNYVKIEDAGRWLKFIYSEKASKYL